MYIKGKSEKKKDRKKNISNQKQVTISVEARYITINPKFKSQISSFSIPPMSITILNN